MSTIQSAKRSLLLLSSLHKRIYHKKQISKTIIIPGYMLCVITGGQGKLKVDDTVFELKSSDLFLFAPGMRVDVLLETDSVYYDLVVFNYVTMSKQRGAYSVTRARDAHPQLIPGKIELRNMQQALEDIAQLYEKSRSGRIGVDELHKQAEDLLLSMMKENQASSEPSKDSDGIERSIGYMHKHFRSKIKLETLSRIAGLTPTSYSRSFRKSRGVTPVEYVNQLRIDQSKQLSQPDSTVRGVGDFVGFGNEFYFSRLFKRAVGISPTVYMKRRELKVAVASCYHFQENLRSLGVECSYAMNGFKYVEQSEEFSKPFIQSQLAEMHGARPDLIIGDHRHRFLKDQLSQIATTVFLDFTLDWRINHSRMAELIGRESEAKHNFVQLERKTGYARQLLTRAIGNETVSLLRLYNRKIRVQGLINHPLNELLYSELGLVPGSCVPLNERNNEFALTSLPVLGTDHLFIYKHNTMPEEEEKFINLQQSNVWKAIQGVQKKQAQLIPNWIGMSWAPLGRHRIMDDLLEWKLS